MGEISNVQDILDSRDIIERIDELEADQELAYDIGAVDPNAGWPVSEIDWDSAAETLKQDYMELDFNGNTYYIRA